MSGYSEEPGQVSAYFVLAKPRRASETKHDRLQRSIEYHTIIHKTDPDFRALAVSEDDSERTACVTGFLLEMNASSDTYHENCCSGRFISEHQVCIRYSNADPLVR